MAEADDATRDHRESAQLPDAPPLFPPAYPPPGYPNSPSYPPPVAPSAPHRSGGFERWRGPLIAALVAVFIVFSILDVSSLLFHAPQNTGTTRPLIINAQVVNDATPAPHPDLGLAPGLLALACGKSGQVVVTNRSARPLQWTVTASDGAVAFSANSPHAGLLGPGQSVTLTVIAFSQPGAHLLHFTDDHGEAADVTVQISC